MSQRRVHLARMHGMLLDKSAVRCVVFSWFEMAEIAHAVNLSCELGLETQKDDINCCLQYQEIDPDLSQIYKYKLSQKGEEK